MKKKVEILAPAGSFDSMKAAVAAGADAVYMGGSRFGPGHMRKIRMKRGCWKRSTTCICMGASFI